MTDTSQQSSNRSAHIGGNAHGNTVQTGDHPPAGAPSQHAMLPPPERVDMRAELLALREVLTRLESPERRKIANALSDAEDALARPEPNKNEVGKALQRTLDYARKAAGFPRVMAVLQPHVASAAAWLGEPWHTLPDLVGRTDTTRAQTPADRYIQVSGDAAGPTVITGNGKVVITQATRLLELDHPLTPSAIGPNPYQGLAAFTEKEANRFFGREALTRKLWEVFRTLHEPPSRQLSPLRLLPILGPSGCGKSSLARAGLLPELARQPHHRSLCSLTSAKSCMHSARIPRRKTCSWLTSCTLLLTALHVSR